MSHNLGHQNVYSPKADIDQHNVWCRIQAVLVQHIQKRLPELRMEIAAMQQQKASELSSLGTSLADGSDELLREVMLRQVTQYVLNFSDRLQGKAQQSRATGPHAGAFLLGGARIRHIFHSILGGALHDLDPCGGKTDEQVWLLPVFTSFSRLKQQ
jgi:hypothetical protein